MSVDDYPDIILCPENPNDLDGLRSLGYGGPSGYFKGSGKYGWGNNSDHIKNLSIAVSTLKSVKDCQTRKSSFMFYPNRRMDEKVKFNLTAALNPHLILLAAKSCLQNMQNPIHCFNLSLVFILTL